MLVKEFDLVILDMERPVLISDDKILAGDKYVHMGEIYHCNVTSEIQKGFKVVATPEQFAWIYNEGPIHDHNRHWKDSRYLEDFMFDFLGTRNRLSVLVNEVCPHYGGKHLNNDCSCKSGFIYVPLLHQDKIIIDLYNILNK
jgi:hypothetical protein